MLLCSFDQLIAVLRVVVYLLETVVHRNHQNRRLLQHRWLRLQILHHHLPRKAHVFKARVQLIQYQDRHRRIADLLQINRRLDGGLIADRHAVILRRFEAADRLLLAVLKHGEFVPRQLMWNQISFLVRDHDIQNDDSRSYFESRD